MSDFYFIIIIIVVVIFGEFFSFRENVFKKEYFSTNPFLKS